MIRNEQLLFSDLVRCEYYVSSQTNFDHFIPIINENLNELQDEYLMQLKFYSTGPYPFGVYLAASNDSIESAGNQYHYSIPAYRSSSDNTDYNQWHRYHDIPTTQAPAMTTNAAEGKNEIHKDHIGYQIGKYIIKNTILTNMMKNNQLICSQVFRQVKHSLKLIKRQSKH